MKYLGIDIGKHNSVLAWNDGTRDRARWPSITLDYKADDWWSTLIEKLDPDAIIIAEPTGWHYLAPVAAIIHQFTTAQLWLAAPDAVVSARNHFAAAKTDQMDARALAYIASLIALGDAPRNVRPYLADQEGKVVELRLLVNKHARLTRASTRAKNQINVLGHSLWPGLPLHRSTWLRLVERGAVTPRDIKLFVETISANLPPGITGHHVRYFSALANSLPDISVDPLIAANITELAADLRALTLKEAEVMQAISDLIHQPPFDEVTRRWLSIPRATPALIAPFHVATHGNAQAFNADALKSVIGINPVARISGAGDKTRQSRKGYRPALNALWQWAMLLLHPAAPANPVRDYYQRQDAANHPHAFTATRSKLARIIAAVAADPSGYHPVSNVGIPPTDNAAQAAESQPHD